MPQGGWALSLRHVSAFTVEQTQRPEGPLGTYLLLWG